MSDWGQPLLVTCLYLGHTHTHTHTGTYSGEETFKAVHDVALCYPCPSLLCQSFSQGIPPWPHLQTHPVSCPIPAPSTPFAHNLHLDFAHLPRSGSNTPLPQLSGEPGACIPLFLHSRHFSSSPHSLLLYRGPPMWSLFQMLVFVSLSLCVPNLVPKFLPKGCPHLSALNLRAPGSN